ncbi:MAG: preprotein translocase subunit SecE [Lachnospiraceae bacterium]|nr:preprotein translocase subunit SecE [Lachnospiraceae bacterium]
MAWVFKKIRIPTKSAITASTIAVIIAVLLISFFLTSASACFLLA